MTPNQPANYVTQDQFAEFKREQQELLEKFLNKFEPMIESYQAAVHIGKWVMVAITFLSIMIGIVLGALELIKNLRH